MPLDSHYVLWKRAVHLVSFDFGYQLVVEFLRRPVLYPVTRQLRNHIWQCQLQRVELARAILVTIFNASYGLLSFCFHTSTVRLLIVKFEVHLFRN